VSACTCTHTNTYTISHFESLAQTLNHLTRSCDVKLYLPIVVNGQLRVYIWLFTVAGTRGALQHSNVLQITVGNHRLPRRGQYSICAESFPFNNTDHVVTLTCFTGCIGRFVIIASLSVNMVQLCFVEIQIYRRTYFIGKQNNTWQHFGVKQLKQVTWTNHLRLQSTFSR